MRTLLLLGFLSCSFGLTLGACSDDDEGGQTPADAGLDAQSGSDDPGALVAVSMESSVGVLLDDFPEAHREHAAALYLAEDDAFWIARAHRQIDYTWYRLVFRQFFYDEGEKLQLPLPPEAIWDVTLKGSPERRSIDGHDLIVVDYDFTTTILAAPDSPQVSEPMLGEVGGSWDEPFVLPVDPELLLHRTGYACVDESDFPLNSVDGENAWQFFDQTCEVETVDDSYCHITVFPEEGCVEALENHVGKVDTALHYERLAWDEALADEVRSGELTTPDGADLDIYRPGLENNRVTYRYFEDDSCAVSEGCIDDTGFRRLLQFDAISHNVGGQPLHIGDVDYYLEGDGGEVNEHNLYELSECHGHYHFSHYGAFYYGDAREAVGGKRAFCLESTNRLSNNETTALWSPYGFCDYQGIAAGWGDMYQAGLDCQWVDITDVATPTTQKLSSLANPDDLLCEGQVQLEDDGSPIWMSTDLTTAEGEPIDTVACVAGEDRAANNEDSIDVAVPAPGEGLITSACNRGQAGPRRDCDYAPVAGVRSCAAGESVTLSCSVASAAAPMLVRACEASHVLGVGLACTYAAALANQVVDADGAAATVELDCPLARSTREPGGRYALYVAPLFDGDAPADVTCTE
jgi:hypothetical protein